MVSLFTKDFINKNKISLLISLVLLASFIIENINGRFWLNDFKVYYTAASHLIHGKNLYNEPFGLGSGYYKYSPFAALFFVPFTFLSYYAASVVYFFIVSALIIYVLNTTLALITKYQVKENSNTDNNSRIIILFVFLVTVVHLQRELHLGNVNILLLAILLFALKEILENKIILPALLLAIVILFKPHFLIFIPLLILRGQFKIIGIALLFIFVGLLLPSFFYGIPTNIFLLNQWLSTMTTHNAGILQAEQTIYFILNHYILQFFIPHPGKLYIFIILLIVALGIIIYIIRHNSSNDSHYSSGHFMREFFLLLAIIPSLTLTDTEHFLLTLPVITLMIYHIRITNMKTLWLIFFWIGIVFYAGNIHDLLGSNLSAWVLSHGLLGIGNLLLIVLYYIVTI